MTNSTISKKPWSSWHNRLLKQLRANPDLLPERSFLLLSVSGGQDSMALLQLILDLRRIYEWKLAVWHGDHAWHENSSLISQELRIWCEDNNVRFASERAKSEQSRTEVIARNWRYKTLLLLAEQLSEEFPDTPCQHIITGHSATDRAETFLLNLSRGSGLGGLSSLRFSRKFSRKINLVRPLLIFSRQDTYEICKEFNLPIWLDPSNDSSEFARNRIRKDVLPVLESLHPGVAFRIASVSEKLTSFADDQKTLAILALDSMRLEDGLCRKKFVQLPLTVRSTLIYIWFLQNGINKISTGNIQELCNRTSFGKPKGTFELTNGCKIVWSKDLIKLIWLNN